MISSYISIELSFREISGQVGGVSAAFGAVVEFPPSPFLPLLGLGANAGDAASRVPEPDLSGFVSAVPLNHGKTSAKKARLFYLIINRWD
jgi:hypothetical protein